MKKEDTTALASGQEAGRQQRERLRRATRIWERQRLVFLRLLVDSMDEFGITQAELTRERRKRRRGLAGGAIAPMPMSEASP